MLIAACMFAVTPVAQAQDATSPSTELKDPSRGTLLGATIWGGGHFYAEETNKGLVLLGIGAGSFLAGTVLYDFDNLTPLYLGYAASAAAWGYSIYDGGRAVERYNDRVRSAGSAHVKVAPTMSFQDGKPAPGLALRATF
jgi:hypothetical protein